LEETCGQPKAAWGQGAFTGRKRNDFMLLVSEGFAEGFSNTRNRYRLGNAQGRNTVRYTCATEKPARSANQRF
jgi:hypothetical protein